MPKLKTRKGMAARIRVTRNGKLIRAHAWKSHMLEKKSARRKRAFRSSQQISAADRTQVRRALGV
ncbi:MAG: 50S ribosomal protein L35 [Candidatus Dormibacteraceae bacterium]